MHILSGIIAKKAPWKSFSMGALLTLAKMTGPQRLPDLIMFSCVIILRVLREPPNVIFLDHKNLGAGISRILRDDQLRDYSQ